MKSAILTEVMQKWFDDYSRAHDHKKPWKALACFRDRYLLVHHPGETICTGGHVRYHQGSCYLVDTEGTSMGYPGKNIKYWDAQRPTKKFVEQVEKDLDEYLKDTEK